MDKLITSTMRLVVRAIREYTSVNDLKKMYVSGSFSSKEVTVIYDQQFDRTYMSDIDILLDVSVAAFVKWRLFDLANEISEILTNALSSKGFKTHVSISTTSFALSRFLPFIKPNTVYLYELRPVVLDSRNYTISSSHLLIRPSKSDSLNLVFSSIADYVFAKLDLFENLAIYEKCYILAKRCLTLLYSIMLFNGVYPKSYVERVALAKKYFDKLRNVLSYNDIQVLEVLTEYKLSGNPVILTQKLLPNLKTINKTLEFLDQYFKELALKILTYELANYVYTEETLKLGKRPDNLAILLGEFKSKIKLPIHKRIMYFIMHMTSTISHPKKTGWKKLKIISHSLLTKGFRIEDLLRYLVSLKFLLIVDGKARRNLKSVDDTKLMWDSFMM